MVTVMKSMIRWIRRLGAFAVAAVLIAPAALAQDSVVTSTSNTSVTTNTTSFVSDWRLWALVGAVIFVIIIIALTRRGGGDTTTIVK